MSTQSTAAEVLVNQIVLTGRPLDGELLWEAWRQSADGFQCIASGHDVVLVLKTARTERR